MANVYQDTVIFNKPSILKFISLIKTNCVMRKDMSDLEADLLPKEDGKYSIGSADKRWANIYGTNLIISQKDGTGGQAIIDSLTVTYPQVISIGKSEEKALYDGNSDHVHFTIKEIFSGQGGDDSGADIVQSDIFKGEFTSAGQFRYSPYLNKTEGANKTATGLYFYEGSENPDDASVRLNLNGSFKAFKVYSAVFNDYAELRETSCSTPGCCVIEDGKGKLELSKARLLPGANIISDTYGMLIGQGDAPIAVCGRVLAYAAESLQSYQAGDAVCSGPDGTISKMTREEIKEYPDRIIGYVSEIPEYEFWGSDNIKVNGRIWIKVI